MKIYNYNGQSNITGRRIKTARENMQLSQSQLAAKLQLANVIVEQKVISRIELGARFVADYELLELSKILKVSVNWLLTGEE